MDDADFRAARLIVGPVYEEELPAVIGYAEEYAVPVVSPLADVKNVDSDVLFQMAPPQMRKYAKIEELTQGEHKQVTLIYGEKNDREFEREILAALQGVPYARHNYRYAVKEATRGFRRCCQWQGQPADCLSDSGSKWTVFWQPSLRPIPTS